MTIPWPSVCAGYMVNLNHFCLTRSVRAVAARRAAHLLVRWREMEMHTSRRDAARRRRHEGGWKGGGGELRPGGGQKAA